MCNKHTTISNTVYLCSSWLFPYFLVPLTTLFCLHAWAEGTENTCGQILGDASAKVIFVWESARPPPSNQSCKFIKVKAHTTNMIASALLSSSTVITLSLPSMDIHIHTLKHELVKGGELFVDEIPRQFPKNHRFPLSVISHIRNHWWNTRSSWQHVEMISTGPMQEISKLKPQFEISQRKCSAWFFLE